MKKKEKQGSALIMTVVLTVLLAIVAVMFVAVARMDMASTSNIADDKTLDFAAKSIVEIISKELVLDTPGVAGQEYYDYADECDPWLASLQPFQDKIDPDIYKWHQISDVTGYLRGQSPPFNCARVSFGEKVIPDYPPIILNTDGRLEEQLADADGDGIGDAKWIELENLRSSTGGKIYAAVRVIDNCGMVNINTAHTFDPCGVISRINGSSQMQINLRGLLKGTAAEIDKQMSDCNEARCGGDSGYWPNYENNVIWDFNRPTGSYVPFDISDELELRYRYCIDSKFKSRLEGEKYPEMWWRTIHLSTMPNNGSLYDDKYPSSGQWGYDDWGIRITEPNDPNADRRHLLTTYNYDRIINPSGGRMININTESDPNKLYYAIRGSLPYADANFVDVNGISAQITANIIDYRDSDSNVTDFNIPGTNIYYYGFEQPCLYISEVAYREVTDTNIPATYMSYAIELYKPYADGEPNGWKLYNVNTGTKICDVIWPDSNQFHVITWQHTSGNALLPVDNSNASVQAETWASVFAIGDTISLTREVNDVNGVPVPIVVDSILLAGWPPAGDSNSSIERDITLAKCIRRLWNTASPGTPTLGIANSFTYLLDTICIQAHPANAYFTNIGEIGKVFRKDTATIGPTDTEADVFVNLADPNYQKLFNYLTVIGRYDDNRVKGRINLNTAPWYVIAQLPWVSRRQNDYNEVALAKAIVVYRDATNLSGDPDYSSRDPGIAGIGELCNVIKGDPRFSIAYYSRTDGLAAGDQTGFPDLTPNDNAPDDFEERDLLFARISNLVTVRSDVFTAYILVRVCTNVGKNDDGDPIVEGPQKRYMAILDRSQTTPANRKVKIISFQPVPGAR